MKNLKRVLAALVIAVSVANISYAQTNTVSKMEQKEHVCTAACKDGKHMYAHGEKGHVCTKACKKMMKKNKNMEGAKM